MRSLTVVLAGALSYKVVYNQNIRIRNMFTCQCSTRCRAFFFSCLMRPDESEYSKRFPDHRSHENESQEPETGDNSWMNTDGDVVA